jgi:P-type Ca2+ transporter type 2C
MPGKPFHTLSTDAALEELDTNAEGLMQAEVSSRLEEYGPNEIESKEGTSALEILWNQIKNPLVAALVFAGIISLLAGEELDAIVILVVIVVNTLIGFFQEYKAETAIEALRSQVAPEAEVLRHCPDEDGDDACVEMRVKATGIVPGDIILLSSGDRVPADARLLTVANLQVDESMLTGESVGVAKKTEPMEEEDIPVAERLNLVYGGTTVTEGRGKAVVFATGERTEMGRIATLIQETEEVISPLQRQTLDLSKKLGLLALISATAIFGLGLLRGLDLHEVFLFALAMAVSSIPEGLPAVMSITLAVGVTRMAQRNAIIRRLQAVDTLGAATVICTDKTGTLTTNQMTVQQIFVDERVITVTGTGFTPEGDFEIEGEQIDPQEDDSARLALEIGALCTDAHLTQHELDGDEPEHRWEIRGDPTEGALVVAAAKANLRKGHLEKVHPRIDEIPFSSDRRFMATFHEMSEDDNNTVRVYVKGAPDTVTEFCDRRLDNEAQSMGDAERETILDENRRMASEALRVLAVAYETLDPDDVETFKEELEYGRASLIFVGLMGMMDPPRPEAPEAVERCKGAGIRVIMATGDHKLTGEAIARQVGIFQEGDRTFTGQDMDPLSDDELDDVIGEVSVFARVSPEHKHRLVQSLQRQGQVVAMTGDGVNDAPALKAAEIGVAMGITGTDVTKETAEIVLTDDNFTSIVNAVEEGRVVFENVRKVVKYLLATNFGEVMTLFGALLFIPEMGLIITPAQILWVNLVTDGILDISLAMEPKERSVMEDRPRDRDARIINTEILLNTAWVSLFMAVGTLGIFMNVSNPDNAGLAQTMAFTTLAMFQVFNALNCRSRTKSFFSLGLLANKYLAGAIVLSVALQVLVTRVPFLQVALETEPLDLRQWGIIVLVTSSVFVADELRKFVQARIRGSD